MDVFEQLVEAASGVAPYEYQRALAEDGLPEVLDVPTGSGKTLAAVLPWLYRRRFHPNEAVRAATPRRLAVVLPLRVLVEQTYDQVRAWRERLRDDPDQRFDVADLELALVRGGEGKPDSRWRVHPERDTVIVGTLDLLLSRALNRGYAAGRRVWPIDFGLLHSGTFWVFDEVQLMGPALATSRQLEAFRRRLGTAAPSGSMWMSATVDRSRLATIDNPEVSSVRGLDLGDRTGPLRRRLDAEKRVEEVSVAGRYERELARVLASRHRPGTRTIAILNAVERAQAVAAGLTRQTAAEVVLLHSRYRPADRRAHLERALAPPPAAGSIVVSTQVLEAGVDISSATMLVEAAPWPSVVQRAGRCNRAGEDRDARLLWVRPPEAPPYEEVDIGTSVDALRQLEGEAVTPATLAALRVETKEVQHAVLRRRDLVELFDTAPDLTGDDVDVGRFIRDGEDLDVHLAWRELTQPPPPETPPPTTAELCPVPLGRARRWLRQGPKRAWWHDAVAGAWAPVQAQTTIRPGQVVLVDAAAGGYTPEQGFNPGSTRPVEPVAPVEPDPLSSPTGTVGEDLTAFTGAWVPLVSHLADVEREVRGLAEMFPGLNPAQREAAALAGRWHDLGKAHPVFQETLLATETSEQARAERAAAGPWAKSARRGPRHRRAHFRHELVSALALLGAGRALLRDVDEPDLAVYLVAAHHGVVRMAIRSMPGECECPDAPGRRVALGVCDGEDLGAIAVPGGVVPAGPLDLTPMGVGAAADGLPSWAQRALDLRDREDLGPFRLAALEALVRVADWRASEQEEQS